MRLDGRVAVVTGGAGGLGEATSRRLIVEGARVVVADLDVRRARSVAADLGDRATAHHLDVTDESSVKAMFDDVIDTFGRIDLLDNNAAMTNPEVLSRDGPVADAETQVWDDSYAVNLRGFMLGCKHVIPHMLERGGRVIVNMSSDSALGGDIARTAYGCTKAAVLALTQYVATQYGKQGIRCVSITPGAMMTENMKTHMGDEGVRILERHHMSERLGRPEDIGALVAFLASDDAGFITGVNIPCDGGYAFHLPAVADMRN